MQQSPQDKPREDDEVNETSSQDVAEAPADEAAQRSGIPPLATRRAYRFGTGSL